MDNTPTEIRLQKKSRQIVITYDDGSRFELSFEYLRVNSPSAEVKGHGPGQEVLQTGKENVRVKAIEPIGHYAVRLVFDDGHDTGLFGWEFLLDLGENTERYWQEYLNDVKAANASRLPTIPVGHWTPSKTSTADRDTTGGNEGHWWISEMQCVLRPDQFECNWSVRNDRDKSGG